VLSWKYFYCQGTTALFHIQEIEPLRMRQTDLRSVGKISAEITVLSWKYFKCQSTTTLFHNQETAPLRMLKTEI
jgi:hypothetical protein